MLLGIDYPYWETLGLRSVFPGLEDKLKVFPSSTIYNEIVTRWPTLRAEIGKGTFGTPDLMRKIDTLYGAYLTAIKAGAKAYNAKEPFPVAFKTAEYLTSKTGFSRGVVVAFLTALESLARAGRIDSKYWDPDRIVAQNKAIVQQQAREAATQPQSPVDKVYSAAKVIGYGALGLTGMIALMKVTPYILKKRG